MSVVFKNSGHREKIAKFFSRSKKGEEHFDRPSIFVVPRDESIIVDSTISSLDIQKKVSNEIEQVFASPFPV